jgi:hypothetical protein
MRYDMTALLDGLLKVYTHSTKRWQYVGPWMEECRRRVAALSPGQPLVTVSNHVREWDDPLTLAMLPFREDNGRLLRHKSFGHALLSQGRSDSWMVDWMVKGHVLPITIGLGIRQPAISQAAEYLSSSTFLYSSPSIYSSPFYSPSTTINPKGHPWVHVFVEGLPDVRSNDELRTPIKHGIARLLLECRPRRPLLLPFIFRHSTPSAMDNDKVTEIAMGRPLDGGELVARLPHNCPEPLLWFALTRHIQRELQHCYRHLA